MAIHFPARRSFGSSLGAAIRRLVLTGVACALVACGGSADAPPPPETVPTVVSPPADQSVVEGTAATFSVSAAGAMPLVYQWSSSVDDITFTPIGGATSASYNTGPTTLAQSGTRFRVVVSNSLGSATSSAATLTVTPAVVAPTIVIPPADQTVIAPATATFNVTATGTSMSYAWQVSTDGGETFTAVVGAADASSLALANTTTAQSGNRYRVVVGNAAGSVTSGSALLTVTTTPAAPLFITQPASQTIAAGQSVSFTVAATGTPAPTLQWRLGGAPLTAGTQAGGACAGAGVNGVTSATLTLTNVPLGCSGATLSAVASNGVGADATSSDATLTVAAAASAPLVTLQPLDATVSAPNTATFTAAASGAPSPTVQWYLSGNGVTWTLIGGAISTTYTTPATAVNQSGTLYRATFTNASGSVNSTPATLTVTNEPRLLGPAGVALDAQGNLYIADLPSQTIRKLTPAGLLSTLAGQFTVSGTADGTGSAARFEAPSGVAVDSAGTVYVSDSLASTIRKITPAGVVTTFAGMVGVQGGADGTGTAAQFNVPQGLAVDGAGNVYVADAGDSTIRKITPAGVVTTLAGVSGTDGNADGPVSVARFDNPVGVAIDANGNIYVTEEAHNIPVIVDGSTVRKITPVGIVSTVAGLAGHPGSVDGTGSAARFDLPAGIAVDAAGTLFVADAENDTIRMITPAGVVTTMAGSAGVRGSTDGTGSAALFRLPFGCAIDAAGNLYIGDQGNGLVRKITPAGVVTTIAR